MRKTISTLLLAAVLLIGLWVGGTRWIESTPEFAVYRGLEAAQQQNVPQFTRYVDVDAVAHAWVQQHVKEVCQPEASSDTDGVGLFFSGLFRELKCNVADGASQVIEPELKGRILSRVEAGNLLPIKLMQASLHPYWGTLGVRLASLVPIIPGQDYQITHTDQGDLATLQITPLDLLSKYAHYSLGLQHRSSGWKVITYTAVKRPARETSLETPEDSPSGEDVGEP